MTHLPLNVARLAALRAPRRPGALVPVVPGYVAFPGTNPGLGFVATSPAPGGFGSGISSVLSKGAPTTPVNPLTGTRGPLSVPASLPTLGAGVPGSSAPALPAGAPKEYPWAPLPDQNPAARAAKQADYAAAVQPVVDQGPGTAEQVINAVSGFLDKLSGPAAQLVGVYMDEEARRRGVAPPPAPAGPSPLAVAGGLAAAAGLIYAAYRLGSRG